MKSPHETSVDQLGKLIQKYPLVQKHVVVGLSPYSLFTTDIARELVENGLPDGAEEVAKICDSLGQEFKARIIRENILGQK